MAYILAELRSSGSPVHFAVPLRIVLNKFSLAIAALKAEDDQRDYIVISSMVTSELHQLLSSLLAARTTRPAATVFLTTYGGEPGGAFRIGRCLRHHYKDHVRIVVPSVCKSAGTLVAIAANELAIGDLGELGPLDIQVHKGSELQEQSSGLDVTEAVAMIRSEVSVTFHELLKQTRNLGLATKLSAEFAAMISSAIAAPLLSQIDPIRMGELRRLTRIAVEYGERLNESADNLKPDGLLKLVHDYPAHAFVIDRKEARKIFERVYPLTDAESQFVKAFWPIVGDQASTCHIVDLDEQPPTPDAPAQPPGDHDE